MFMESENFKFFYKLYAVSQPQEIKEVVGDVFTQIIQHQIK